jgi:putative peptidoglycan lipid II flippase
LPTEQSNRHAVRSAGKISIINSFGFISALLIDVVIAGRFGLSQDTDALFIALTLPQLIVSIFLVAANVALVPHFTKVLLLKGKPGQWQLTSNLMNLGALSFVLIGLVGSLVSPLLITFLGAGLDQSTKILAIDLSRILFLMVIPIGAVEILKATLNALHSFSYPAATAVIKNLAILLTIFISPSLDIRVVAVGYVIATFVQLLFLLISLMSKGFKYQFSLRLNDKETIEALRQMRHPLAGAVMGQGNVVVERFLASFLPLGVVSALGYARRVLRAVDNIFLGSVTTAFLPRLSAQSANSETKKYKSTVTASIKMLAFISLPITALVIGLSESIVRLLFERGAFSIEDTQTMALLLRIYVTSIPAWAIFQALQIAYYSTGDTKRPFLFRIITLGINIVLDLLLFYFWGAPGLALALALARTIITFYAAWRLDRLIKIINAPLVSFLTRIAIAALLFGIIVFILRGQFGHYELIAPYATLVDMIIRVALGALIFALSLFVLQVKEAMQLVRLLKVRFGLS